MILKHDQVSTSYGTGLVPKETEMESSSPGNENRKCVSGACKNYEIYTWGCKYGQNKMINDYRNVSLDKIRRLFFWQAAVSGGFFHHHLFPMQINQKE
jgi:hypothetical protein